MKHSYGAIPEIVSGCPICNHAIDTSNTKKLYCSNACKQKAYRTGKSIGRNLTNISMLYRGIPSKSKQGGFVYIIKESFMGLVKIGMTKNLRKRFLDIKNAIPQDVKLILYFDVKNPKNTEYELHRKYRDFLYSNEWFLLSDFCIEEIRKNGIFEK